MLPTLAGPEIGVASTKAFTTQLAVLACLAIGAGARARRARRREREARADRGARRGAGARRRGAGRTTRRSARIAARARRRRATCSTSAAAPLYPMALEGALKLKEITYIHAEGYAAGELKHGPIALIDESVPVIVRRAARRAVREDRVEHAGGRGARRPGDAALRRATASAALGDDRLARGRRCPTVDPFVAPILYAVPVQLLAYHTAVLKGTDVDQPRNLAKSVTVE